MAVNAGFQTKTPWQWEDTGDGASIAQDPDGGLWEVYADYCEETGMFWSCEGPGDEDRAMGMGTKVRAQREAEIVWEENR